MRDEPLDALLAAFADRTPSPGGGAAAGIGCALGAALAEMGARFAGDDAAAERAAALRAQGMRLAEADAAGYAPVLEAVRLPRDTPDREARLHAALARAADVPLAIAEAAADVALLAADATERADGAVRADAAAAAVLAAGAARAAAKLVGINLSTQPGDERIAAAERACDTADTAAREALSAEI